MLISSLAITQRELATMGFVGCALVMYILWWNKPFDVEHSVAIDCPAKDQDRILLRLPEMFEVRYDAQFLSPYWNDSFVNNVYRIGLTWTWDLWE